MPCFVTGQNELLDGYFYGRSNQLQKQIRGLVDDHSLGVTIKPRFKGLQAIGVAIGVTLPQIVSVQTY